MAFDRQPAERTDRRARRQANAGGEKSVRRGSRLDAPASGQLAPGANAAARLPPADIDGQIALLWAEVQRQMLNLLTRGVAAPFQRSAFDKLEYSMKQYGKLQRGRADDLRGAAPDEPDADEIAAILDKMDRRIDGLAEQRFKKLAERELHGARAVGSRAGVDV